MVAVVGWATACSVDVAESPLAEDEFAPERAVDPAVLGDGAGLAVDRASLDAMVASAAGAGQSVGGLELRIVDAPLDVDEVWVRFCGVYVQAPPSVPAPAEEPPAEEPAAEEPADDEVEGSSLALRQERPEGAGPPDDADEDDEEDEGEEEDDADAPDEADEEEAEDGEEAEPGEGEWLALSEACLEVDLLQLQGGVFETLGLAALPAGEYGQIRLMLDGSWVVVAGERHDLTVPSGSQSGLKVEGGFLVEPGVVTALTLDFDAEASVHRTGNGQYKMVPVVFLAGEERFGPGERDGEDGEDPADPPEEAIDPECAEDVEDPADEEEPDAVEPAEEETEDGASEEEDGEAADGEAPPPEGAGPPADRGGPPAR